MSRWRRRAGGLVGALAILGGCKDPLQNADIHVLVAPEILATIPDPDFPGSLRPLDLFIQLDSEMPLRLAFLCQASPLDFQVTYSISHFGCVESRQAVVWTQPSIGEVDTSSVETGIFSCGAEPNPRPMETEFLSSYPHAEGVVFGTIDEKELCKANNDTLTLRIEAGSESKKKKKGSPPSESTNDAAAPAKAGDLGVKLPPSQASSTSAKSPTPSTLESPNPPAGTSAKPLPSAGVEKGAETAGPSSR